jgi:hypothetical protein
VKYAAVQLIYIYSPQYNLCGREGQVYRYCAEYCCGQDLSYDDYQQTTALMDVSTKSFSTVLMRIILCTVLPRFGWPSYHAHVELQLRTMGVAGGAASQHTDMTSLELEVLP